MMKHRTQILLDPWQYEALKEEAFRLQVSFSTLVRRGIEKILGTARSKKEKNKTLESFAGIIKKSSPLTNKEMDDIVYGKDWE